MINFSRDWKAPLIDYDIQIAKGVNRRRALRFVKRKYKFDKNEYNEFVSRTAILM
ncbi:MAG: hypothetical protein RR494_08075 [Vagococcus sp.]|uniref:hypothetical protein n=1 Tax=Vagococcus sp. TaxID=1933889 RepID=UPI002FC68072